MSKFVCTRNGIKRKGESCVKNDHCIYPTCSNEYEEPAWVCFDCAKERGARVPQGHCYTTHVGICGICNTEQTVTEPRDFGTTRHLLRIKK